MKIFIYYDDEEDILKIRKQVASVYQTIIHPVPNNSLLSVVLDPSSNLTESQIKKLTKKYEKINGVEKVVISSLYSGTVGYKNYHCFFDIDGTLTTKSNVFTSKLKRILEAMKKDNIRIYLASGRNVPKIRENMKELNTEPYGIAENGGVIIGLGDVNQLLVGDRTQPDHFDHYLKKHHKKIREDLDQGMRFTERIYRKDSISLKELCTHKNESDVDVDINPSKNSFHICKHEINKYSAIEKLTSELQFGEYDKIVAVGDSDMDMSMINEAEIGFAVNNASHNVIEIADVHLKKKNVDGIEEMYLQLKKLIS